MEDLIYVLALIAWVVFAFYRKSQKKAANTRRVERQPQQSAPMSDKPSRPFPTFEDILLGREDYTEDEPEPEFYGEIYTDGVAPRLQETAFEKEYELRGITSIEELDKPFKMRGPEALEILSEEREYNDAYPDEWRENFDARQAVIFSEILNRPYA